MSTLVLALRGAAAVAVLTTLVGGIPRIVQAALAVAVGLWAAVVAGAVPPDGPLWLIALRELVVGATLGVLAAIPLLAAAAAGRLVDVVVLPDRTYGSLFGVLAAAVFVGIDGHVTVVRAIAESYASIPVLADAQPRVLAAIGGLVAAAVRLAIPWLVTAAVVEIAVGIGARLGARAAIHAPRATAVPAAIAMMTAALVGTLAVAIAQVIDPMGAGRI